MTRQESRAVLEMLDTCEEVVTVVKLRSPPTLHQRLIVISLHPFRMRSPW